jgi:hypothetical protein
VRSARHIHIIILAIGATLWLLALCAVGATVYYLMGGS